MRPARPRRVAYVLTQDRGGPVDVTVELARELDRLPDWDVRVFAPPPARGADRVAALHQDVRVERKAALSAARRARKAVLGWRPDLVHAQDRRAGLVCAGLSVRVPGGGHRPAAVVHTYHGVPDDVTEPWFRGEPVEGPSRYTRATLAADAVVARAVTRTVVPAAAMGRFLQERLRVPGRRVVHIDNGLVLPAAAVHEGPVRRLLFVGLLVRRKGVHLLLEALTDGRLPSDVRLLVAGDGPERSALEEQARRAGLADRVDFLGFRTDVPELLASAHAFVLPSSMEQQPLVLIEAMGAGKAVVATDVGGVRDLVGDAGIVVPPDDVPALTAALQQVTTSFGAEAMGRRAADRARARFSVEHCRDQHRALYEDLLRRRGSQ